jgi:hypothetical protein
MLARLLLVVNKMGGSEPILMMFNPVRDDGLQGGHGRLATGPYGVIQDGE